VFTSDELQDLALFCDVCDKAFSCRLIRTFSQQSHHIFVGTLPDGRVVNEYPRYDDDDLRAFLTHYRKLRMEGERTCLPPPG
jgi:flavin reductase (DIM6/NTAB) family NADH-FMN oxidoreductase RutF